ncbi:hypothetical protein [Streptomyces sp. SID2119]|uniref:hypothetical protein n=1 Tax=Streptomyces sp. SID2119 TaxID=2690253 RepID=UPI00136D8EBA|nr:hypothetical protein [Streptomyces sp. SID2119]MYW29338.1 hypothetical protein [Streptomyces sp. SID2119]
MLLTLVFTSGSENTVERKVFFGSMMFKTVEQDGGALDVTAGVENPIPLFVLFLVTTIVLTMIQAIYQGLKRRRDQLLKEMPSS